MNSLTEYTLFKICGALWQAEKDFVLSGKLLRWFAFLMGLYLTQNPLQMMKLAIHTSLTPALMPLAAIARANPNHLDVEINNIHADSDTEAPDDDVPQPSSAPINKEFSWRQRKPPAADIDSSFQVPAFSPPPEQILSPKWYFDQFMDKSVFEHISHQSNLYAVIRNGPELKTTQALVDIRLDVQERLHTDGLPEVQSPSVLYQGQKLIIGVPHKKNDFH